MSRKVAWIGACSLLFLVMSTSGCFTAVHGPQLGLLGYPIPISPYFQNEFENEAFQAEHYDRVAIMDPIPSNLDIQSLDPPSDDEILRALEKARPTRGGSPLLHTRYRNNIRITKHKLLDQVDEPRMYPGIGPAQLHHVHYLCKIYFSETTIVGWPIPYTTENEQAMEVVYIDHDHFHRVGNVDSGPGNDF
jgi:hypothetical protein